MGTHVTGQPQDGAAGPAADTDAANGSDLLLRVKQWHRDALRHRREWLLEAEEAFDYVAGNQWNAEDLQVLRDQDRPAVTFNGIAPFIDGVCGLEIGNRQEQRVIPRQLGASGVSDMMTAAVKWVRDECDAEDEESEAFRDCVICGEGWTQTRMEYRDDPDGVVLIEKVDPLAVLADPASAAPNYADARYLLYARDVTLDAAREIAPGFSDTELDATWAKDPSDERKDLHDMAEGAFYRPEDDQSDDLERTRDRVRIVEVEWWEPVTSYRMTRKGQRTERLSSDQFDVLNRRAQKAGVQMPTHVRDTQRRYMRAIVGAKVLCVYEGAARGGFSLKAMTGKRDRNHGHWYGLVRAMKDPQMWSNKWLSQILHIINSNAKGGYFAEEDAFSNPQEAQDTITDPQSITWVTPGAVARGAIKEKVMPDFPAGLQQLTEFAITSIPRVTGVSPEMMGQVDRTQPGVLEMQRKQQGMTLLAWAFNALRRYRKEQGRLIIWYIQEFISDGRLIRIGGPEQARYVPLIRDPRMVEYDVVVDDTPSSPNMKERTWGMLVQLFPVLARLNLPPQAMLEMFKYSPLPETLIEKIAAMMQQMAQGQQGDPHAMALAQTEQAKAALHGAQTQKVQAETQKITAETGVSLSKMQAEIESLKAAAIANMAKAGVATVGPQLDAASAAADRLLTMQQQMHDQAMDHAQLGMQQQAAQQAAQQQQHQQAMDVSGLGLQQAQADQGNALATRQQDASEQQAAQANQLAQQQAAQRNAG